MQTLTVRVQWVNGLIYGSLMCGITRLNRPHCSVGRCVTSWAAEMVRKTDVQASLGRPSGVAQAGPLGGRFQWQFRVLVSPIKRMLESRARKGLVS